MNFHNLLAVDVVFLQDMTSYVDFFVEFTLKMAHKNYISQCSHSNYLFPMILVFMSDHSKVTIISSFVKQILKETNY